MPREDVKYWIGKAKQGDVYAFRLLVDRYRPGALKVANSIVRDSHEAEDIVQESFVKAFLRTHELKEEGCFKHYLYRVTIRLCIDHLRRRKPVVHGISEFNQAESPDVELTVVLEKILSRMNPHLRAILVLREVRQFDYQEIADMLGIPVGTVRSRLHLARERFRKLYVAEVGD